ncbi:MAG: hypothetical protein AAB344_07375 [Bacteroidota bacterium]
MIQYRHQASVGIYIFLMLLFTVAAQVSAQTMPSLDPKILPYQRGNDVTGSLTVAGSYTMKTLT